MKANLSPQPQAESVKSGYENRYRKKVEQEEEQLTENSALSNSKGSSSVTDIRSQLGDGRPLDPSLANKMSAIFQTDFSAIKVHTDESAHQLNRSMNAKAFAVGNDIAFSAGAYQPNTPAGDLLIAHELSHAIQQQGKADQSTAELSPNKSNDEALEKDANSGLLAVLVSLYGKGNAILQRFLKSAKPKLQSGLQVARCDMRTHDQAMADGLGNLQTFQPSKDDVIRLEVIYRDVFDLMYRQDQLLNTKTPYDSENYSSLEAELDDLDAKIKPFIEALRALGVTSSDAEIYDEILGMWAHNYGGMIRMSGDISVLPQTPIKFGERTMLKLNMPYYPPGREIKVRWIYEINGHPYPLILNHHRFSPAWSDASNLPVSGTTFAFDEATWYMLGLTQLWDDPQIEFFAYVYLGDDVDYSLKVGTGIVDFTFEEPDQLDLLVQNQYITKGTVLEARINNWVPPFPFYATHWYLDGKPIEQDLPYLDEPPALTEVGSHTLSVKVHEIVEQGGEAVPGMRMVYPGAPPRMQKKKPKYTDSVEIIVMEPDAALELAFENNLKAVPYDEYPDLPKVYSSIKSSISTLKSLEKKNDDFTDYYEDSREAQEKRKERLEAHTSDLSALSPLPADPKVLSQSGTYSRPIAAGLFVKEHGEFQPLNIYLNVEHDGSEWTARILDVTGEILKFDGSGDTVAKAIQGAFEDWEDDNPYPQGCTVIHNFKPSFDVENKFSTNSAWKTAKEWIDSILLIGGLIIGALLLLVPEPTGVTKALGVVIMVASIARGTVAIAENIDLGYSPTDTRNVLEAVGIITAALGVSGSALRQAGLSAFRPLAYRVGNWMIMTSLVADIGTMTYMTVEAYKTLQAIQNDPTIDESTRLKMVLQTIASLMSAGMIIIGGNKSMFKGGLKKSDFFKTNFAGKNVKLDVGSRMDIINYLRKNDPDFKVEMVQEMSTEALLLRFFGRQEYVASRERLSKFIDQSILDQLSVEHINALALADDALLKSFRPEGKPPKSANHIRNKARQIQSGKIPVGNRGGTRGTNTYNVSGTGSPRYRGVVNIWKHLTQKDQSIKPDMQYHLNRSKLTYAKNSNNDFYTFKVRLAPSGTKNVTVRIKSRGYDFQGNPTTDIATQGVHGADTGPGTFSLTYDPASGQWVALIEIDPYLSRQDMQSVVKHELDEIAGIVRGNDAYTQQVDFSLKTLNDRIKVQQEAGIFKPGSTATTGTAHDVAAARELYHYHQRLSPGGDATANATVFRNLMRSMGIDETIPVGRFRQFLKHVGSLGKSDPDFLQRIEQEYLVMRYQKVVGDTPLVNSLGSGKSIMTPELINHINFARVKNPAKGANGSHSLKHVEALNADNTANVYLVREGGKIIVDGVEVYRYRQYEYIGPAKYKTRVKPPVPMTTGNAHSTPTAGTHYNPRHWKPVMDGGTPIPKSVQAETAPLLRNMEDGFNWYFNTTIQPTVTSPVNAPFSFVYNGVKYGGFYTYDGSTLSSLTVNTIFIDATTIP